MSAALILVDQINSSGSPYGKFWQLFAEWFCIGLCAPAVFGGTWRDAYAVMVINTVSMIFQRLDHGSHALHALEPLIVAFIAGAGGAIDVLAIRGASQSDRCHAVTIFMTVLFNYLPGAGIIMGARELKLGNIVLGSARLFYIVVKIMLLVMGITLGWMVQGYDGVTKTGKSGFSPTSLPPRSFCPKGEYEGWQMVNAGLGSIWILSYLVWIKVDPRDIPAAWLQCLGIWCLYGYLAETQPAMPEYVLQASILFFGMMLAGFEEFRGGLSRVVIRVCLTNMFAPSATAINEILSNQYGKDTDGFWC